MLVEGKIIKIVSNLYSVKVKEEILECRARGKFRKEEITPLVGDFCKIDYENKYILEILPRKNYLMRPMIANVDVALIVASVKDPNLSLNLLDKMLSVITLNQIEPMIYFSKMDLLNTQEKKDFKKIIKYYDGIGIPVINKPKKLLKRLQNKMVVVTGQTGAGKSTLLNKLDKNLKLKTDEISKALGRGKHTTRHVELYKIKNCYIADTPGFSSIDFTENTKEEIKDSFREFKKYTCEYKNCMHDKEKNCEVKKAVQRGEILSSRYENYLDFLKKK